MTTAQTLAGLPAPNDVETRYGKRGEAAKVKPRMTSWVVPTALGYGYITSFGAWLTVTGRKGRDPETKEMERGSALEGVLLEWVAKKLGLTRIEAEYRLHDNGWSGDFVDCLLADSETGEVVGVVEAKTVAQGAADKWGTPGTDEVPTYTLLQAQWHLYHHPEVDTVYVPVLFGGYRFVMELYIIKRDEALQQMVVERAKAWWDTHAIGDVPPELTAKDTDYLNARYPHAERDTQADITEGMVEAVQTRLKYESIAKKADDLCKAANNRIREAMGSAHRAKHENFSITWSEIAEGQKTDYEGIFVDLCQQYKLDAAKQLELVEKHTLKVPGYRRLTVTGKGAWKKDKR